jgi:hypothetical protein
VSVTLRLRLAKTFAGKMETPADTFRLVPLAASGWSNPAKYASSIRFHRIDDFIKHNGVDRGLRKENEGVTMKKNLFLLFALSGMAASPQAIFLSMACLLPLTAKMPPLPNVYISQHTGSSDLPPDSSPDLSNTENFKNKLRKIGEKP